MTKEEKYRIKEVTKLMKEDEAGRLAMWGMYNLYLGCKMANFEMYLSIMMQEVSKFLCDKIQETYSKELSNIL